MTMIGDFHNHNIISLLDLAPLDTELIALAAVDTELLALAADETALTNIADITTLTTVARSAAFAIASAAANITEVTITLTTSLAAAPAGNTTLLVWLSDALDGEGLTATSASGTVTAKAASGTVMGILTAKKCIQAQAKDDGTFILEITDTAKTGFYVACQLPGGEVAVSRVLVTGDYG